MWGPVVLAGELGLEGLEGVDFARTHNYVADKKIPVFSCEGPCIRGDIARRAANLVAHEVPSFARACHGETFFVPQSSMARWVRTADKSIMIDGCFLKCHGRVLSNLVEPEKVLHIDANLIHHQYSEVFSSADVPEAERQATARQVADRIIQIDDTTATNLLRRFYRSEWVP